MKKRDLVIYGAGGHGREVMEIAESMNDEQSAWNILGFLDDAVGRHGTVVDSYPVLGGQNWLCGRRIAVSLGVGSTPTRRRIALALAALDGIEFATLVHPCSTLSRRCTLDVGTQVLASVAIATRTHLGRHVLVGRHASIGHDIVVDDYANIFPGAVVSGESHIGEGCEIGSNATVIPGIEIGEWSVVGAGSVVTRDLPANVTAVGMPARAVKRREAGWHLG